MKAGWSTRQQDISSASEIADTFANEIADVFADKHVR